MNMLRHVFLGLIFTYPVLLSAQGFEKFMKKGDDFFEKGIYHLAAENYDLAVGIKKDDAIANLKLSQSYIKLSKGKLALQHAFVAQQNIKEASNELHYTLGGAYHLTYQFDQAKKNYQLSDPARKNAKEIAYLIKQCEYGKEYLANPVKYKISNMGKLINSKSHEYLPKITADGEKLYFTSRRPGSMGDLSPDGQPHEDIYVSTFKGGWTEPKNVGKPLNSEGHNACIGLTPDGQTMFLYNGENGGDIYISHLKGSKWSTPKSFPLNTTGFESSVCVSPDEKLLFFVSASSALGNRNIYVCKKAMGDRWSKPVPLRINTPYDEESPYLHPDGKTLYFSSKGHSSMGGYDIFKVDISSSGQPTGRPKNLGYPINTTGDDLYFVLSAEGRIGFYSSEKAGGSGKQDIYSVVMPPSNKPDLSLLKGKVLDQFTGKPVEADITITDNSTGQVAAQFKSNSQSGEYIVSLPAGKNYGITIEKDEHLFYSDNVDLKPGEGYKEINKNIQLVNVKPGSKMILKNIFFETGSSVITKESITEIKKVYQVLKKYPHIKIEISGHTDNVGDSKSNLVLSQQRAGTVMNLLIEKGIPANQLTALGYGDTQPIASNTTSIGKKQNRRTEFKIL